MRYSENPVNGNFIRGLVFDIPICYPKTMLSNNDLQAIGKVVEKKIDNAVAPLKGDIVSLKKGQENLESDVSALKSDVTSLKKDVSGLKTDLATLKEGQEELREEMNRRFDVVDKEVYDTMQEVIGAMGDATEGKIQKLRSDLEPRVAGLERIHPQGEHAQA